MDYNSRQTRQRYIHKQRLTNLCTPAHSQVCTQSPSKALWTTQMHLPCMYLNTHKDAKQALCTQSKHGDTSTAGTMGGKQTQSRYCLGSVCPKSPGGLSLTLGMCVRLHVCVWLGVSSMLSWHCLQWKAAFQFNYEKKRQRGGRWGSMLMLLCEGTLTLAHTAKQLGELNCSTRSESRRMGQEKGGCVRKTHTKNRWRGRGSDRETVSMGPQIQFCKQV